MRTWLFPIFLLIVLIGAVAYAAALNLNPVAAAPGEIISGTKRWAGTWNEEAIRVQAGEDLGEPDVTIEITVMRPVFIPNEITVKQGQVVRLLLTRARQWASGYARR